MKWFEASHACVYSGGFDMNVSVPTFGESRRSRVLSVVTFIIERDCFEAILGFFDIGARPDFIIPEKDGAAGFPLQVYLSDLLPLLLRKDLERISLAVSSGLKAVFINKFINFQ